MKHLLLLCSVFTLLFTVSCNRDQDQGATSTASDIQREEDQPGQTPGFENEEYRDEAEGADVITPVDDRPELEEERPVIEDEVDLEEERPDLEEEMEN